MKKTAADVLFLTLWRPRIGTTLSDLGGKSAHTVAFDAGAVVVP